MFKKIIKGFDEQGSHRNALGPEQKLATAEGSLTLSVPIGSIEGPT